MKIISFLSVLLFILSSLHASNKTSQANDFPGVPEYYIPNEQLRRIYVIDAQNRGEKVDTECLLTMKYNPKLKADEAFCKLGFELMQKYAQSRPKLKDFIPLAAEAGYNLTNLQVTMLINRETYKTGQIRIDDEPFMGIAFEQDKAKNELFGVTRLTFLHEICHLSEDHVNCINSQDRERDADKAAVIVGDCELCNQNYAKDCIDHFKSQNEAELKGIPEARLKYLMTLSLTEIDKMDPTTLNRLIEEAKKYSFALKANTHPLPIERALTVMYFNKFYTAGKLCNYHTKFRANLTTANMLDFARKIMPKAIMPLNHAPGVAKHDADTKKDVADCRGTIKFKAQNGTYDIEGAKKAGYIFDTKGRFEVGEMVLAPRNSDHALVIGKIVKIDSQPDPFKVQVSQRGSPVEGIRVNAGWLAKLINSSTTRIAEPK